MWRPTNWATPGYSILGYYSTKIVLFQASPLWSKQVHKPVQAQYPLPKPRKKFTTAQTVYQVFFFVAVFPRL